MSRKLKDVALSNQVYAELRKDLISGRYEAGEKITISSLAEAFGVSPTPVREAIRQLVAEGGLDLKPNHSVTVAALTAAQYREITAIRLELEGLAAFRAASRRSERQLAKFIESNDKMEKARAAGRFATVLQHNREFHFALTEMAGTPILASVLESLWLRSGPLLNLLYDYGYQRPVMDHPHDEVIAALKRGDPADAKAAIQRDIKLGTDIIAEHLERSEARVEPAGDAKGARVA
ncbi:MAG: GntR family transcriptional regulator [Alphaproteobacteria bacterium]